MRFHFKFVIAYRRLPWDSFRVRINEANVGFGAVASKRENWLLPAARIKEASSTSTREESRRACCSTNLESLRKRVRSERAHVLRRQFLGNVYG